MLSTKAFGQHEKLTRRLRRILSGYPFDKEVLKELVQNADDAGASTLVLVTDPRTTLPVHTVQGRRWQSLQNPALCVYSDSAFTRADLQGIQDLGQGSKEKDPTKTGQYGVGFNAVYHFTETPTFLSEGPEVGKVLCALDPHAAYVPDASHVQPGTMFDDVDQLEEEFPGILDGFLTDHFPMENATMFRFPLRTPEQAKMSEISQQPVDINRMKGLLDSLQTDVMECLLFLNNIKSIEVGELDLSGSYYTRYRVDASLSPEDTWALKRFQDQVGAVARQLGDGALTLDQVPVTEVTYHMRVSSSRGQKDEWLISQRLGLDDQATVSQTVREAYAKRDIGMLPRGGVACLVKSNILQDVSQSYDLDHRLFCFLPLPQRTVLPVHVNGHFALDNESRRGLWQDDGGQGYRSQWNKMLLDHIIAPLYVAIMHLIKAGIDAHDTQGRLPAYEKLFPRHISGCVEKTLAPAVYRLLQNEECLPVTFPGVGEEKRIRWYRPHGCFFHGETDTLARTLRHCGLPLAGETSGEIYRTLNHVSPGTARVLTRQDVINHLHTGDNGTLSIQGLRLKPMSSTVLDNDSIIAIYDFLCGGTRQETGFLYNNLEGLPLVLTAAGNVGKFSRRRPLIRSAYYTLCHDRLDSFLHPCLEKYFVGCTSQVLKSLTLGTLADLLPGDIRGVLFHRPCAQLGDVDADWLTELWKLLADTWQNWMAQKWDPDIKEFMKSPGMSALGDWCILPAQDQRGDILLPLREAASVVDTGGTQGVDSAQQSVAAAVRAYGLPRPLTLQGSGPAAGRLLSQMVASIKYPDGVLYALKALHDRGMLTEDLPPENAQQLLRYFNKNIDDLKDVPEAIETLQRLPGYKTMGGKFVSLENRRAYVLPTGIPQIDMEAWFKNQEVVFLQDTYKQLLPVVGCHMLTIAEVYITFILQHFELLSKVGRKKHLEFLRDTCQRSQHGKKCSCEECGTRDAVVEAVRTTPCFERPGDGRLMRASDFYDPSIEVFKLFEEANLPSDSYVSYIWKEFLTLCGLKNRVTEEHLLSYARKLSRETSKGDKRAEAIVDHLFASPDAWSVAFLNELRIIPFLPRGTSPVQPKCMQDENQPRLMAFYGAVTLTHADTVWTGRSVLPSSVDRIIRKAISEARSRLSRWANGTGYPQRPSPTVQARVKLCKALVRALSKMSEALGVIDKPALSDVINHTEKVCQKMAMMPRENLKGEGERILEPIYAYLETNLTDLKAEDVTRLQSVSLAVAYDTWLLSNCPGYLVRANQLSRLGYHTFPYHCGFTTTLEKYQKLMMRLGAQISATAHQYAHVLHELHTQSHGEALNPSEQRDANTALIGLVKVLDQTEKIETSHELFLPAQDGRIYRSAEVVVVDDKGLAERVGDLQEPFLRTCEGIGTPNAYELSCALQKLPELLRPKKLSTMFSEVLDEERSDILDASDGKALILKSILSSADFNRGIVRILRHIRRGSKVDTSPEDVAKKMNNVDVLPAKSLETYVLKRLPEERLEDTRKELKYFIRKANGDHYQVYIVERWAQEKSVEDLLSSACAEVINELFHCKLDKALHLVAMCLRSDPGKVAYMLDEHKVAPMDGAQTCPKTAYDLGDYVNAKLQFQLDPRFVPLNRSDLVAVELCDPLEKNFLDAGPTYVIGRVLSLSQDEQRSESGYAIRYNVQIKERPPMIKDYPASKIYSFSRNWREIRSTAHTSMAQHRRAARALLRESEGKEDSVLVQKRLMMLYGDDDELCRQMTAFITGMVATPSLGPDEDGDSSDSDLDEAWVSGEDESEADREPITTSPRSQPMSHQDSAVRLAPGPEGSARLRSYIAQRARDHARDEQEYQQGLQRGAEVTDEPFVCTRRPDEPNPQPAEATRWQRQARRDLQGSQFDLTHAPETATFEWTCCRAAQSAEKALKSVLYSIDADKAKLRGSDLLPLLEDVNVLLSQSQMEAAPQEVTSAVTSLSAEVPDQGTVLFPTAAEFPHLAGDSFTKNRAAEVCALADVVTQWAEAVVRSIWNHSTQDVLFGSN